MLSNTHLRQLQAGQTFLQALQRIDFSDNYVTDLSPLSGLKDLRQVVCGENPVSNDEVLGESVVVVR